jgi:hypothetical protein
LALGFTMLWIIPEATRQSAIATIGIVVVAYCAARVAA